MKKLHSINSIVIPYPAEEIWQVITDLNSYQLWWPTSVKTKIIIITENLPGSQIEIKPFGGLPFYCEIIESVPNSKLVMKYSGLYSGLGVWHVKEINKMTEVVYEINLEINNIFVRAVSYLIPVNKIHFKLMN